MGKFKNSAATDEISSRGKFCTLMKKTGHGFSMFFSWIYKLRGVFMAIPVAWAAIALALQNNKVLPAEVGIWIRANGTFAFTIPHAMAVYFPLLVTGLCIVLMFCTKKPLYPWLISIMTLILPFYMTVSLMIPM